MLVYTSLEATVADGGEFRENSAGAAEFNSKKGRLEAEPLPQTPQPSLVAGRGNLKPQFTHDKDPHLHFEMCKCCRVNGRWIHQKSNHGSWGAGVWVAHLSSASARERERASAGSNS